MIKCPICGREHEDTASFCTECGVKLNSQQPKSAPTGEYMHSAEADSKPLSMWEFTLMELIARIPVVNLVLFFVWGFSKDTNENRKNWSRSRLIWAAISLVLSILGIAAALVFGGVLATVTESIVSAF